MALSLFHRRTTSRPIARIAVALNPLKPSAGTVDTNTHPAADVLRLIEENRITVWSCDGYWRVWRRGIHPGYMGLDLASLVNNYRTLPAKDAPVTLESSNSPAIIEEPPA